MFLSQKSIDKALADALRRVLAQKDAVAELESQKSDRDDEAEKIFDDQQRLRENMKALKGSPEEKALLQRYAQQLDSQENRLAAIRKEIAALEVRLQAGQAELDRMIKDLAMDVRL